MVNFIVCCCVFLMSAISYVPATSYSYVPTYVNPYESPSNNKATITYGDAPIVSSNSKQTNLLLNPKTSRGKRFTGEKSLKGHSTERRRKRAVSLALGIFRGVKAAEHLLSGTKQVPSTNRYYNEYQKSGNFAKALADFDSVKPTNVRKFNLPDGTPGMWGMVGDRMVIVSSTGELGKPTMEIVQGVGQLDRFIDKITYVDDVP